MHRLSAEILTAIRRQSPLIHNITNFVVMNSTANALLALGASPVMAHAKEEVAEIVSLSSALVINIGTLSPPWVESMFSAIAAAKTHNIPWVLDPVGVGASRYRTETARELIMAHPPAIIRGNSSEIRALALQDGISKGVDSTIAAEHSVNAASHLAQQFATVVIISGATDFIVTEEKIARVYNGDEIMRQVTGMGCTATALTGACLGVSADAYQAGVAAMAIMGVSGELAVPNSKGPGGFQVNFLDQLYHLDEDTLIKNARIDGDY